MDGGDPAAVSGSTRHRVYRPGDRACGFGLGSLDNWGRWAISLRPMRFQLFGFPVRIHFSFLLVVVLAIEIGWGVVAGLLWAMAVLSSVILHELGHAATVRRLGGRVSGITIYALGGVTYWQESGRRLVGWRLFAIAAAGSGVGLFAGLGLYAYARLGGLGRFGELAIDTPWRIHLAASERAGEHLVFFVGAFVWVSVFWGVFNWLPIGGLDGSKMLRAVLVRVIGPSGDLHSRIISTIVGVVAAFWAWRNGFPIAAILVGVLVGEDLMSFRNSRRTRP